MYLRYSNANYVDVVVKWLIVSVAALTAFTPEMFPLSQKCQGRVNTAALCETIDKHGKGHFLD